MSERSSSSSGISKTSKILLKRVVWTWAWSPLPISSQKLEAISIFAAPAVPTCIIASRSSKRPSTTDSCIT